MDAPIGDGSMGEGNLNVFVLPTGQAVAKRLLLPYAMQTALDLSRPVWIEASRSFNGHSRPGAAVGSNKGGLGGEGGGKLAPFLKPLHSPAAHLQPHLQPHAQGAFRQGQHTGQGQAQAQAQGFHNRAHPGHVSGLGGGQTLVPGAELLQLLYSDVGKNAGLPSPAAAAQRGAASAGGAAGGSGTTSGPGGGKAAFSTRAQPGGFGGLQAGRQKLLKMLAK